jgi:hypothetical protein
MALDPTIALQAQAPSFDTTLKPISSLLGIQGQLQDQQTRQLQQNQLQGQLQERDNIGKIDWSQFRQPDGGFDSVGASNAAMQAAPSFYGPMLSKQFNEMAKDAITIKQGMQDLNQSQRTSLGSVLGALAQKQNVSRNDIYDGMSQYVEQNPSIAPMVMTTLKHMPQTDDPKALQGWLEIGRNGVLKPSEQRLETTAVSTGGDTRFYQKSPYVSGAPQQVGDAVPNTVSPTQREEIQTDSKGNRYIVQRGSDGTVLNTRQVPGTYNAIGGKADTGPVYTPPGGDGQIKDLSDEVTAARAAIRQAPVLHDINRGIVSLIDKGVTTGSPSSLFAYVSKNAQGVLPFSPEFGDNTATNYNMLGKYLERSALQASQGMGPHTNAGLEAQIRANGSLDYTPQAVRKIAVLNDALVSGAEKYNAGLQAAIKSAGNSVGVKPDFDQAWAQNFDPNVMRYMNAAQNNDQKERAAVLSDIGALGKNGQFDPNSAGGKALVTKMRNLQKLTNQGHL